MAVHRILFYSLIFLLPTQLSYHWWPDWSYVLGRRIDYLSPTLYVTDILLILGVVTWAINRLVIYVNTVKLKTKKENNQIKKLQVYKLYIVTFLLYVFLNIVIAENKPVAIYKWMKVSEIIALGLYIYTTKPNETITTLLFVASALYSSILAIIQYFIGQSVGGFFWFIGERTFTLDTPGIARMSACFFESTGCHLVLRPYATFSHPNVLGGFLACIFIMALYLKLNSKAYLLQLALNLSMIVIGFGIVLTFSRSAWIATAVGIVLLCIFRKGIFNYKNTLVHLTKKNKLYVGAFIVLGFILLGYSVLSFQLRSESVTERISLASSSLLMWWHSPFVGTGLGNFLVLLPRFTNLRTTSFLQPAHSLYLMIIAEAGLFGFCLLLWFVYFVTRGFRFYQAFSNVRSVFPIIFIIILLLGFFDHYFVTLQQGQIMLGIVFGFALLHRRIDV